MWFPLHTHSHFSLLDGLSQPHQIAERIEELGYEGCALTDHGTIAGCPGFLKALGKKKKKAILGCEFYLCQGDATVRDATNRNLSHLCVLARNLQGWKNLIRASSASYRPEHFYRKPRLDLEKLGAFAQGQYIVFSGHMGSDLANCMFKEPREAYSARTVAEAESMLRDDHEAVVAGYVARYQRLFGKENFYLEIQLIDRKNLPASEVVARVLRGAGKKLGVPRVATADSHYCRREDAVDQRAQLCVALDTTNAEVERRMAADEDISLGAFFRSSSYHIPSPDEMKEIHTEDELANALEIGKRCESYSVGGKPLLPAFPSDDGTSSNDRLRSLCDAGWKRKVGPLFVNATATPWGNTEKDYEQRLARELDVILNAKLSDTAYLSDYFLIKADIIRYATDVLKTLVGKGRGSAAGCLTSYLSGITRVDPLKFGLIFERFYNSGRNAPGRVALPDIDSDFCVEAREKVIDYIREKYGHDRVSSMATFSRMQGRGAIKDVLRVNGGCSFEEMNRITEWIPDEAAIADELQEMREETGEASIIRWALENNSEQLKEWAVLKEDGTIEGPLEIAFAQAIRLEGTKRNMGKHASGIIICSEPLADIVPMAWDRSAEQPYVGVDMRDAEDMGLVKVDILGLRTLSCLQGAQNIVRTGKLK